MDIVLTVLLSATGGALISSFSGFLNTYSNNKQSFKMLKEKDKYEYTQYRNRYLLNYLEELERECTLFSSADDEKVIENAGEVRNKVRSIHNLSIPFLNMNDITHLATLYSEENENCKVAFKKLLSTGDRTLDENDRIKIKNWFESLSLLREELVNSITKELLAIRMERC